MSLTDRSTTDVVIIILALLVGATILLAGAGVVLVELYRPEVDTSAVKQALITSASTLAGGVLGYLGGRGHGGDRREQ